MTTIFEALATAPTAADYSSKLLELQNWLSANDEIGVDVNDPVLVSLLYGPLTSLLADEDALIDSIATYGKLSSNVTNSIQDESLAVRLRQDLADQLGVSQSPAGFAVGEVTIRVSSSQTVTIPQGSRFTDSSGLAFETSQAYFLRSPDQQTGESNERPLRSSSGGVWYGTVPVSAMQAGSQSNITSGTPLNVEFSIFGLQSAMAGVNFVGGREANSVQDLIDAVFANTASRTLGNRDQITSFLQNRTDIGNIRSVGVIGFGDQELLRDRHSFLPLQAGGKSDLYLASEYYPTTHSVLLDAVLVSDASSTQTFSLGIGRDVSPGYLRIVSIQDTLSGESFEIAAESRAIDASPILGEQVPAILEAKHGSFSRFQTATVTFSRQTPSGSALAAGDSLAVEVTFQRVPGIDTAQSAVSGRLQRYVGGDTLVRSAIPIFLTIRIRITSPFETAVPSAVDLQESIASEIMRRPMRPKIYRSDITTAIGRYLPDDLAVESVEFEGLLIGTDGKAVRLTSEDDFECPNDPLNQLSPRTVAMYATASEVNVSVSQVVTATTP